MDIGHRAYRLLRLGRIAVSLAVMVAVAVAVGAGWSLWLSRWQIVPALLAGAGCWVILWTAVTALAGRIYCSTACPMGTLQDVFAAIGRRRRGYFYRPPRTVVRWTVTVAAVAATALGIPIVLGLLDPAAAFNRIVVYLGRPLVGAATFSVGAGVVAAATLAVAAGVAAARGRLLCNTICPVGTLLGAMSRYSIYHIDINTDRCTGCGLCVERCKASCIDPSAHTVDPSRCVVCFDCTAACPNDAITLRRGRHRLQIPMLQSVAPEASASCDAPAPVGTDVKPFDRRRFLATLIALPAAAIATATDDQPEAPLNAVRPPGGNTERFMRTCTGCGTCVAACPTHIIRPAGTQYGLRNALHPVLDFDLGACLYDCVACTQACPTGALAPLTPGQKHRTAMGKARVEPRHCIEYSDGAVCGLCARRCPVGAISISPTQDGRRLPRVDFDRCIGCGACRYVCPGRPGAIIIEGEV